MNKKLVLWSVVIALGGFLFGFDTAVISGAEQKIKEVWGLSSVTHGIAIAIALYGTVIGAMAGGSPATKFGRKKTLFVIGIIYLVSALGSAIANTVGVFMVFRMLGGLAIGASSVVAPMYISEIAPARNRGMLVATFQFNIVFGILIAYFSNYLLRNTGENDWRFMLGIVAVPSLIYCLLLYFVPESPRWLLIQKNDLIQAKKILQITDPQGADQTIASILDSKKLENNAVGIGEFFTKKLSRQILLALLIAFFNQLSGINAIIYFAPRVFELAGLGKDTAFLQSAGIGVVNVIFTMLGLYLIDKLGRKKLMIAGSIGYIVSLAAVAAAFYFERTGGFVVPVLLFVFIASHAIGQGAVIWVFISEIFPNNVRAYGQSLGSSTHWVLAAVITTVFPIIADRWGPAPIFTFFAAMMILQLIWVIFIMPETKGLALEQIVSRLNKTKHEYEQTA
ncbi:MAG: sugar porter family MFS transporter [Ferruginibacter sp.]